MPSEKRRVGRALVDIRVAVVRLRIGGVARRRVQTMGTLLGHLVTVGLRLFPLLNQVCLIAVDQR